MRYPTTTVIQFLVFILRFEDWYKFHKYIEKIHRISCSIVRKYIVFWFRIFNPLTYDIKFFISFLPSDVKKQEQHCNIDIVYAFQFKVTSNRTLCSDGITSFLRTSEHFHLWRIDNTKACRRRTLIEKKKLSFCLIYRIGFENLLKSTLFKYRVGN